MIGFSLAFDECPHPLPQHYQELTSLQKYQVHCGKH